MRHGRPVTTRRKVLESQRASRVAEEWPFSSTVEEQTQPSSILRTEAFVESGLKLHKGLHAQSRQDWLCGLAENSWDSKIWDRNIWMDASGRILSLLTP